MAVNATGETPYAEEVRFLWRVALAVFVITIGIGLVNGQRVVEIGRPLLLTHLHTGTVGWITLSLFAAVLWLFTAGRQPDQSASPRTLVRYVAAAVGCYPVVFFLFYPGGLLSSPPVLGVFGTLALIGIVWMLVWTIGQARQVYMSVARWAALGAVLNLAIGALLGVLIEARFAGLAFPGNVNRAHLAMMTIGYILPAAFAFVEWRLGGGVDGRRSLAGTIAVGLLIVGGWLAVVASVADQPALFPPILLFQIVATLILVVRMAPKVVRAPWGSPTAERHVAVTALAIPFDVALLVYAIVVYLVPGIQPPPSLFIAIAHTEFVGMITNSMFATILLATAARRQSAWPWADNVVFWAVNVGWVGFAAVELIGAVELIRLFTPIMGVGLLIGLATHAMRLSSADEPAVAAAGAAGGS